MKKKLSISVDEDTVAKMEDHVGLGIFRNKSHMVEYTLNKYLEERE